MKIESVRIENLGSFSTAIVPLNDYTCLMGPNGAGKSTILYALNIFFRESKELAELKLEDFHQKNAEKPIRITVTFTNLSEEAQKDFSNYFRHGKLIVSAIAEFNKSTGKAVVRRYGQRMGIADFREFFRALGDRKKVADLRQAYGSIRENEKYRDLPDVKTEKDMTRALKEYESSNRGQCELLPSEDQFFGFSGGSNLFAKHVQWVYIPAVKDPASEQVEARNSALGKLLARTVRLKVKFDKDIESIRRNTQEKYEELIRKNQGALNEISSNLQNRITQWAHPGAKLQLRWEQDPDKSIKIEEPLAHIMVGEGGFEGQLVRFGHGLQRSYLFALLQELAEAEDIASSTLILACEEPELYQHPPQVRHLAFVLGKLSSTASQVIVSTHNPLLVSGQRFEDMRMVRKNPTNSRSSISHMSYEEIAKTISDARGDDPLKHEGILAKIHQALRPVINEMFFTHRLVLVEGQEDVAYILAYLNLLEKFNDYRRMGCHVVPVGGKQELLRPLVIARRMGIPTYVVFDADLKKTDPDNKKTNKAILTLSGNPDENPMPNETLWGKGLTMWHTNFPSVVKDEVGRDKWEELEVEVAERYGHPTSIFKKNPLYIAEILNLAYRKKNQSESLKKLCAEILDESNIVLHTHPPQNQHKV